LSPLRGPSPNHRGHGFCTTIFVPTAKLTELYMFLLSIIVTLTLLKFTVIGLLVLLTKKTLVLYIAMITSYFLKGIGGRQ